MRKANIRYNNTVNPRRKSNKLRLRMNRVSKAHRKLDIAQKIIEALTDTLIKVK